MISFQYLPEKNLFMMQKANHLSVFFVLSFMVLLGGCRDTRAVQFLWPDLDDPYIAVTQQWTRSASVYSGIETELIVHATLKSRPWQQAYVQKKAQLYSLNQIEREELYLKMATSSLRETEIFISLFSPKPEQARIRFNDPLWSIFIQDQDKKIYPLEIRPVRQPLATLSTFYPYVRQWRKNYILRFPVATGDSLSMIMTGPLGRVELDW